MIQFVWLTLLAAHTGAAAVWWWLMPGGFSSASSEYWVNEVAPILAVAILLTALLARGRFGHAVRPAILAMIPVFWMLFGISSRLVFEESFRSSWNLAFIGGAGVAILWGSQFRHQLGARWLVAVAVVVAAIAGWSFPGTQRSADAATVAGGASFGLPPATNDHKVVRLTKDAQIRPDDARVVFRRDKLILNVQPLLSFADRSPDRCWVALAPEGMSKATSRSLVSKVHDGARWSLAYKDEDASIVDVSAREGGAVLIDARSRLTQPIYSHANTFAELTLQGHQKLSVSFSPLPDRRVEVAAATEPARFAYVDAGGMFHVMQASDGKRGPFTELGAAPLKRTEPLLLTIYDADKPVFTIALDDWAAQASTQLSPAAGSQLAVNAIEMVRGGPAETSAVLISFSLASSSIGRGTQSVGHAAGVYRDRITVTVK